MEAIPKQIVTVFTTSKKKAFKKISAIMIKSRKDMYTNMLDKLQKCSSL